jgi:hypothetical protein
MSRHYALTGGIVLALCGSGCDESSEVIARERTAGDAGSGGEAGFPASSEGGANTTGEGGAPAGGEPGVTRPRFATPTPVDELNDPDSKDQDPTLTEDELEIFFFSDRDGNADIWMATRGDAGSHWDPPVPVTEVNSVETDQNPAISRDGLRLWFSSKREPAGIYFASRPSRDEPFGTPEPIPIDAGGSGLLVIAPSVDAAELRMAVSIGTAESRDLYELVRPSLTASWGAPAIVPGVNFDGADSTPFLIDDGRELLLHSGRLGLGDLFWAYRESPGLDVERVEPLSEVNDPLGFESHPHLTVNRKQLYFGSDRDGNTEIYVANAL